MAEMPKTKGRHYRDPKTGKLSRTQPKPEPKPGTADKSKTEAPEEGAKPEKGQ